MVALAVAFTLVWYSIGALTLVGVVLAAGDVIRPYRRPFPPRRKR